MLIPASTPPRFATLVLLTALATLSLNMFLPSLANIARDFRADYALVNLSIAGYLGITAVLQLIIGPLSDRFGRRPVMQSALALFVLASLGAGLATDIHAFLAFRVIQGAIIAGSVISQAVIRDMFPAREAASRMGYVSMAMAVAPMVGPMVGGALDELFGWRSSFVVFTMVGAAAWLICWFDLGETNRQRSADFSAQFRAYPDLVRSRRFWGYALCTAFSTGAFYTFLSGVPLVARADLGLSPAELGVGMGSITGGYFVGSFLSGRFAARLPLSAMMIAGRLVACAGLTVGLANIVLSGVSILSLFGATIFVGIGNGLTMPSSNAGALSVRPHLAGSAAGLSGSLTVGTGAALTSVTGLIISEAMGAHALVGMMLFCSLVGLLAALGVWRIDRHEGALVTRARIAGDSGHSRDSRSG